MEVVKKITSVIILDSEKTSKVDGLGSMLNILSESQCFSMRSDKDFKALRISCTYLAYFVVLKNILNDLNVDYEVTKA